MLVLVILLLLTVALLLPYGITLGLNARMLRRLERTCRETGFRMKRLHPILLPPRGRGRRYDLLLENRERIYAVKLWSATHTGCSLVVTGTGQVYEQKRGLLPMDLKQENRDLRAKGAKAAVPRTVLSLPVGEKRPVTRILLQYPAYREVLAETEQGLRRLSSGSPIFDKLLYSPSAFETLLRENCTAKSGQTVSNKAVR